MRGSGYSTARREATLYASILGEPLVQKRGTEVRFLGLDPHGDVAYLADPSGAPVGWRSYGPWGEVRQASGESSTLGFQGDPTDPDTGLVDLGARLYAPGLGRFTSLDPLSGSPTDPLSLNRYVYARADPVSLVDPTGLCPPQYCYDPGYHGAGHSARYASKLKPSPVPPAPRVVDGWSSGYVSRQVAQARARYQPKGQPRPSPVVTPLRITRRPGYGQVFGG